MILRVFETSANINATTQHHIPEDQNPQQQCCRNFSTVNTKVFIAYATRISYLTVGVIQSKYLSSFFCYFIPLFLSSFCSNVYKINLNLYSSGSWWGNRREGDHWGDLGVDGRIILGWISRKWDVCIGTGLGWPRIETGGGRL